jgi:hypothetical protein
MCDAFVQILTPNKAIWISIGCRIGALPMSFVTVYSAGVGSDCGALRERSGLASAYRKVGTKRRHSI